MRVQGDIRLCIGNKYGCKSMREVTRQELARELDNTAIQVMKEAIDNDFEENNITGNLLKSIKEIFTTSRQECRRNIGLKIILREDLYKYASFEAYKVRGKAEKHFGDILGIICLGSANSLYIGMFSLEAKIIEDGRMKSFEYAQLIRLLKNNVFIKWIIYDKDEISINIVNPRMLLHFNTGNPTRQCVSTFTTPFSTYIIEFLLNGNDSFIFIKQGNRYKYPPHDSPGLDSTYKAVKYYIEKTRKLESKRPPSYILTLNSHNNEITFRKGLDILQEIINSLYNIFPNYPVEPIGHNPNIDLPRDPGPSGFYPSP